MADPRLGTEPFHLGSEVHGEPSRVERFDGREAAAPFQQPLPDLVAARADRGDEPDPGDRDTAHLWTASTGAGCPGRMPAISPRRCCTRATIWGSVAISLYFSS